MNICYHCQNVVEEKIEKRDFIYKDSCLTLKNIDCFVCPLCNETIHVVNDEHLKESIKTFKQNRPSISTLLSNIPTEKRQSWCKNSICACVGAANCSGELTKYLYTEKDWILWKYNNQNKLQKTSFLMKIKPNYSKMKNKLALMKIFKLSNKEAERQLSLINENFLLINFDSYDKEEISDIISTLEDKLVNTDFYIVDNHIDKENHLFFPEITFSPDNTLF